MSETANSEGACESEKPVQSDVVKFPPFPEPKDEDFEDDIGQEEKNYYKTRFKDLNLITSMRLHCTACDRHLGCSVRSEERMRTHPMLRTLMCQTCYTFYNSGEFEKGDDGSELYCRWCGQGGQVYCCSDCPHVFCAKCIKRNLGVPKIKEIENADDWKCFKCSTRCLWDLRALCWAVLRYCNIKKEITYKTEDPDLKQEYQNECNIDHAECCRSKFRKVKERPDSKKIIKKEKEKEKDAVAASIISKIPSTIQVKKFASCNIEEVKSEPKKAQKRSLSPKNKQIIMKNPIAIASPRVLNPMSLGPQAKKIRIPNSPLITNPIRIINPERRLLPPSLARIRPKQPMMQIPLGNHTYNGFANIFNDNINLSLESLTQGIDMAAVAAIAQQNNAVDDDVVCTPDFPMEPLCEVTEDNDDDVECITPGPVAVPKQLNPPPLVARGANSTNESPSSDNIIQMTENDVTVNEATGGLKFRVDPQTLSSNKMYRLPDGRIFAINANPNMPGGYSATIVAVTESSGKAVPKGATYAAKLSAVTSSTPSSKSQRNPSRLVNAKRNTSKSTKVSKSIDNSRECDLNVPVEWYRYNLIDAVDALEYALSRLNKLKKEATSVYLRSRTLNEMRNLHKSLERLLSTSANRFNEVRENLNNGFKQYVSKKNRINIGGDVSDDDDDDDDVEILPNMNEDPIFIDENSMDSNFNGTNNQEVDLTGPGSSEYNDSADKSDNITKNGIDPLNISEIDNENDENAEDTLSDSQNHVDSIRNKENNQDEDVIRMDTENTSKPDKSDPEESTIQSNSKENEVEAIAKDVDSNSKDEDIETCSKKNDGKDSEKNVVDIDSKENEDNSEAGDDNHSTTKEDTSKGSDTLYDRNSPETTGEKSDVEKESKDEDGENSLLGTKTDGHDNDDKMQDTEMSEELIATLLNDDSTTDDTVTNTNSLGASDALQET